MQKKFVISVMIGVVLGFTITGCTSFQETYKPLYQAKPEIKEIKGK